MSRPVPNRPLEPQLVSLVREGYSREQLGRDLLAGIVVGIVALPLAIAFAIASGVRPEQGLYTAIVAGFVISVLGGSRVQIGGPTGAFVVLVAGVVQRFGYDGLAVATLMAGVMLIGLGLARLGAVIRFIPYPVTVGFTTGIALIIAVAQVRDALGLRIAEVPAEFVQKWIAYSASPRHPQPLGAGAVRRDDRLRAAVAARQHARARPAGGDRARPRWRRRCSACRSRRSASRFGAVPTSLPVPRLPRVDWSMLRDLVSPAISIALLAGSSRCSAPSSPTA